MRKFISINLDEKKVDSRNIEGQEIAEAGRFLIARMLLEQGVAGVDPLGPENPLIFSVGPLAGTNFSNANRISVGCKSPLTGGIKEANSGGTFATSMGQLEIAGFVLQGESPDWIVIRIPKNGPISFEDATPYMGLGNFDCARKLHEKFGDKTSLALCGPVGEYKGLLAGISFSDIENRPSRLAARGGVGSVMGAKKVKAIVIDKHKMPPLHNLKEVMASISQYSKLLGQSAGIEAFKTTGTAMVADLTNYMGALPVRNFSSGQVTKSGEGSFKLGGDHIRELNSARGGKISHACMRGCKIKCSNVYVDENGQELVSPLEYETIGLMGTNCGLTDPDDVARLNWIANDLGVDSIELGATIGVLMEAGEGEFGDIEFMAGCLADIAKGNKRGRLLAHGTARVGRHFNVARVPVIKKQAISAYDPRVIEVTGISMMVTAQGADHTVGNLPAFKCDDKSIKELVKESFNKQISCAIADSLGLCIFGRAVTEENLQLVADTINSAHGCKVDPAFITAIGMDTLRLEAKFNHQAGFSTEDDDLPKFFHDEPLDPTGKTARLDAEEIKTYFNQLMSADIDH